MQKTTEQVKKSTANIAAEPSLQYCVLIPKRKIERLPDAFARFLTEITGEFGGYAVGGEVYGSWIDRFAEVCHQDENIIILVVIPNLPVCLQALRSIVAEAARGLQELQIFVSMAGGPTFFVWATRIIPR
jgi:hypothetical protein